MNQNQNIVKSFSPGQPVPQAPPGYVFTGVRQGSNRTGQYRYAHGTGTKYVGAGQGRRVTTSNVTVKIPQYYQLATFAKAPPPAAAPKTPPKKNPPALPPKTQKRPPFKPDPVTKKAQTVERKERTKDLSVAGYSSADAGSNKPLQNAVEALAPGWKPGKNKSFTEKDYDYLKSRGIGDREIFNEGVKRNLNFSKGMKQAWQNELAVNPDDSFSFMNLYKSGLMNSMYGDRTNR